MEKHPRIRVWAVLFWLMVWQVASVLIAQDIFLVSPIKVLYRLAQLAVTVDFWASIGFSLFRISIGFLAASLLGTLLAALSAKFKTIKELIAPAVLAIKTTPVASFIILALIWFSSRNLAMLISFLMVLPIIYTNVLNGIQSTDRHLLEMAQVFHVSMGRRIRYIYIPQVMPFFLSGCTVALGLCWKSGIAAEVIGMPQGSIGEKLQQAKIYLDTPDLFAWTLVIVLVSLAFEKAFLAFLKKGNKFLERM